MPQPAGYRMALSLPRRLICDLMYFAKQVPTIPVQRRFQLAEVAAARAAAVPRPGWAAIFTKAYGIVAAARPQLRRSYLSFPWPHLYQHAASTASIAFERPWTNDENAVFFAHLLDPDKRTLADIDLKFLRYKTQPCHMIAPVRRVLRIARLPWPIRRMLWWCALNLTGNKRAHFLGTYGVSTYGALGAASLHPLSVLTSTLNFGAGTVLNDVLGAENKGDELDAQMLRNEAQRCC